MLSFCFIIFIKLLKTSLITRAELSFPLLSNPRLQLGSTNQNSWGNDILSALESKIIEFERYLQAHNIVLQAVSKSARPILA